MLAYDFMVNAFLASTVVAVVAGAVGCFLVLRAQTFAGHALAHVGFTGATGAVLAGFSPFAGMVAATVAGGVGMGLLGDRLEGADVAIGMVLSLSLGAGLLFLHFFTASATQATSLLFGNIFAVEPGAVWTMLALGLASLAGLAAISRPLLFVSLSPEAAEARGVSSRLYSVLFLGIVALTTAECAQVVGVLLVFSLMVGPAAACQRLPLSGGMGAAVACSAALATVQAWLGLTLAFYTDWPASFWITALGAGAYLLTLAPARTRA